MIKTTEEIVSDYNSTPTFSDEEDNKKWISLEDYNRMMKIISDKLILIKKELGLE